MIAITDSAKIKLCKIGCGEVGNIGHRKTQETVAAHFQQTRPPNYRSRGRRLHMGIGQPGVHRPHRHFNGQRCKEGQPQPGLHLGGKIMGYQN